MRYVYPFDHKHRKPPMSMKDLLGGKGANLAEMTSVLGLPVPHGFVANSALYAAVYTAALLLLAFGIFARRDLK